VPPETGVVTVQPPDDPSVTRAVDASVHANEAIIAALTNNPAKPIYLLIFNPLRYGIA
jgi:hypothetical protein